MCLEIIGDILTGVDDALISDIDEKSTHLQSLLRGEDQQKLLKDLEELHFERTREISQRALLAGVAMGRGLASFFPESGDR